MRYNSICLVRESNEHSISGRRHGGGVFERLVKLTKRCLCKVVGWTKLFYDELNTIIVEIKAVSNSRLLTYISVDDLEEPVTPSHFLACGNACVYIGCGQICLASMVIHA